MTAKCWVAFMGAGLLAACASLGGDLPGLFYVAQLSGSQPNAVCVDFLSELGAGLSLRIVNQIVPTRPTGGCIVMLENQAESSRLLVTMGWDPGSRTLGIHVQEIGTNKTTARTRDLASQVMSAVQKEFPEAVITTRKPTYGPLGP
jgi:hypothetical protein